MYTVAGKFYRLTGFDFRSGTRTAEYFKGVVQITGPSKTVRIDHCKFTSLKNRCLYFRGSICGVVDHCVFEDPLTALTIYHDTWAGPSGNPASWGDGSWAVPLDWGGPNAIYIEDCDFNKSGDITFGIIDEYAGARYVFRHNKTLNGILSSHGTGSTGRYRSLRSWEVYGNTMTYFPTTSKNAIHIRGGTGVVFNNVFKGTSKMLSLNTYRFHTDFDDWPGSDGTSNWDLNDTTGGPANDGIYLSGTAGAGSTNWTLVVTGANWATNQWAGYTVRDMTPSTLYPKGFFSAILSSTKNTLTVEKGSQIVDKPFVAGDHFEIRKVMQGLDMAGGSTGNLLTGSNPVPHWVNQIIEPIYAWSNTVNGVSNSSVVLPGDPIIRAGVHYFDKTTKPGYVSYTYPHPLALDEGDPTSRPSAPTNLKVMAP